MIPIEIPIEIPIKIHKNPMNWHVFPYLFHVFHLFAPPFPAAPPAKRPPPPPVHIRRRQHLPGLVFRGGDCQIARATLDRAQELFEDVPKQLQLQQVGWILGVWFCVF